MYLLDDKWFIVAVRLLCSVSVGLAGFPVLSAVELWSYLKYVQGVLFTEGIYPSFDLPYFNSLSLLSSPHNSSSLIEVLSLQWLIYNCVQLCSHFVLHFQHKHSFRGDFSHFTRPTLFICSVEFLYGWMFRMGISVMSGRASLSHIQRLFWFHFIFSFRNKKILSYSKSCV